jgi:hypothetical protein
MEGKVGNAFGINICNRRWLNMIVFACRSLAKVSAYALTLDIIILSPNNKSK